MNRDVLWTLMSVIGSAIGVSAAVSGNDAVFAFGLVLAWSGLVFQWADR